SYRFKQGALREDAMSALGQKQTCAVQNGMSASPPIATQIAFFGMSALGQKRTCACALSIDAHCVRTIDCSVTFRPGLSRLSGLGNSTVTSVVCVAGLNS